MHPGPEPWVTRLLTALGRPKPRLLGAQSAVVTGTAFEVTDPGQKTAALRALCEKMTPGHMEGFEEAVRRSLPSTAVWGIHMEEVTGKEKARKR